MLSSRSNKIETSSEIVLEDLLRYNSSPIRDPARANEPDVPVVFKASNWNRARKRIDDYNEQLIENRKKKGHKLDRLLTGLIEYEAHPPPPEE